jgi:sarcosine oxidase gamma subunit
MAWQTSVAKTTQLVIRDDLDDGQPSYWLIGARSLAAYLWATLLEAAHRS